MSRHRNIRKLNIDEELDDDDEYDYYDRSYDEETPPPDTSKFLYHRQSDLTYEINKKNLNNSEIHDLSLNDDLPNLNLRNDCIINKTTIKKKISPKNSINKTTYKAELKNKNSMLNNSVNKKIPPVTLSPNVESLRVSEKKQERNNSGSPSQMTPNTSFQRLDLIEMALATPSIKNQRTRPKNNQRPINLVIVGHVDAGKSTLVGHLLYLLGNVDDRTMHKNKQESAQAGKSSFAFAWILDEEEEERTRGITMDIARVSFKSTKRNYYILDAPGHKDFIPNMINGASQADAALIVINATRGEFETGFDQGGQTREHALLLRSLGVSNVIAAVNKLDTIDWSQSRFEEVSTSLQVFLQKQAGFENIKFVPVSGLLGTNLVEKPPLDHPLSKWYKNGCTLLEALDDLSKPILIENQPLRIIVNDILKITLNTAILSCKVEAGFVEINDKLFLMPEANPVIVKSIIIENLSTASSNMQQISQLSLPQEKIAYAGDQIILNLSGYFKPDYINFGLVLCRGGTQDLLIPIKNFIAKIIVFNIRVPILKGTRAELFAHSIRVTCVITQLTAIINKSTRQIVKKNPRALTKNMTALVEIQTETLVNLETYPKTLSRFTLRANGQTIAAGIVDQVL